MVGTARYAVHARVVRRSGESKARRRFALPAHSKVSCGFDTLRGIAELYSAGRRTVPPVGISQRPAECNSATKRSAAKPQPKERGQP